MILIVCLSWNNKIV